MHSDEPSTNISVLRSSRDPGNRRSWDMISDVRLRMNLEAMKRKHRKVMFSTGCLFLLFITVASFIGYAVS